MRLRPLRILSKYTINVLRHFVLLCSFAQSGCLSRKSKDTTILEKRMKSFFSAQSFETYKPVNLQIRVDGDSSSNKHARKYNLEVKPWVGGVKAKKGTFVDSKQRQQWQWLRRQELTWTNYQKKSTTLGNEKNETGEYTYLHFQN